MYPIAMDWYFRTHQCRFDKNRLPQVTLTGYNILNILLYPGIAVFRYIFWKNPLVLNRTDIIVGIFIFVRFVLSIH